jgi:dipeptidase
MLADFGQGGICGYEDRKMTYHNSYIIADQSEAWVLETAAQLWAAKKVDKTASISNGLTIGETFDLSHPDIIPTARKKGWLKKGETFNFARNFGDWFYTTFSASRKRQCRSLSLLKEKAGHIDILHALRILRDHGPEEGETSYRPDRHFLGSRICAHGANPVSRKASQTTASLVAQLKAGNQTYWVTGTSAPCTGIFKPVWLDGDVPLDWGPVPGKTYDPESLWWKHEVLHREVLRDFQARLDAYTQERDEMERKYVRAAGEVPVDSSHKGNRRLFLTQRAFQESDTAEARWLQKIRALPVSRKTGLIYRRFWKSRNHKASLPSL